MSVPELIDCPGGCETKLHPRATECPRCGFPAEIQATREQLGSLSTICSILTGFGLASLVALAVDESRAMQRVGVQVAGALWMASSLLLLAVMVLAEYLRRLEPTDKLITLSVEERDRFEARCGPLLLLFLLALVLMAVGVVLLGFHFSWTHGLVAVLACLVAFLVALRTVRT